MNPPANSDATHEDAVTETEPELDLFVDSMDRFIASLIWEEPDPRRQGPGPRREAS